MTRPLVACLVCTNRPEWEPWWRFQIGKQTLEAKYISVLAEDGPGQIPEKRTKLMQGALALNAPYIAWFDDDDWSSPWRLEGAIELLQNTNFEAVGNVRSRFVSAESRCTIPYQAPEGIVFNGAVFCTRYMPPEFSKTRTVGEDTEWLERWHRDGPNYMIVSELMHMWVCHRRNVTNRVTEHSFRSPLPPDTITEEEWSLIPK